MSTDRGKRGRLKPKCGAGLRKGAVSFLPLAGRPYTRYLQAGLLVSAAASVYRCANVMAPSAILSCETVIYKHCFSAASFGALYRFR